MRKPFIAGNWKMNGSINQVKLLLTELKLYLKDIVNCDLVVCPPYVYLAIANEFINNSNIIMGAQNVSFELHGAFTGEISCAMLQDFNCKYVIIGHSERRMLLMETDLQIATKFKLAYDNGLVPILCVGETQEARSTGETFNIIANQLQAVINMVGVTCFNKAIIAYEPVWAIGSGSTATPEQAQQVHSYIRNILQQYDQSIAKTVRIIYGGSVKANNAADLFDCPDVDGGLIGGASLNATEFSKICYQAESVIA